jgi:hypothetical protein
LAGIVANLPAVRAARKVNTLSRVHRRLIEPIETEQDKGSPHDLLRIARYQVMLMNRYLWARF